MKPDLLSLNLAELEDLLRKIKHPKYRAAQIFSWLHRHRAVSFDEMANIPKILREYLAENYNISNCRSVKKLTSAKDNTQKHLFALGNDTIIESVRMEYSYGTSICLSTQAGCRMGCKFCASAQGGFLRNLTAGEICAQVYALCAAEESNRPREGETRISSIVLMGCGEPLDNMQAVLRFIELITHPQGFGIGARHITLSTCGLVPEIRLLAEKKLQINLALSLHAADDATRKSIMPIANRYSIEETLDACRYYTEQTSRRLTVEYSLIQNLNDSKEDAAKLAKLLRGMPVHVNLIPVNKAREFLPADRRTALFFAALLEKKGITATVRRTIGADIDAACGQLRATAMLS